MIENLTVVASASHLLKHGWTVFSKKQNPDTGDWWIMIEKPTISFGRGAKLLIRGEGDSLADAIDNAFVKAELSGVAWSLAKLDVRVRALVEFMTGVPESKEPTRACPHGVSGGRCKQCL